MVPEVRADCTPESEGMHVTCGPPSRTRACTTAVLYCDTTADSRKLFLRRPLLANRAHEALTPDEREEYLALGADLERAWHHERASPESRKRILRALLEEIVANIEGDRIKLRLHWQCGDHTELTVRKNRTGRHRWTTDAETCDIVKELARLMPDRSIASFLNRAGKWTGKGNPWTEARVRGFRTYRRIAVYREGERQERNELTLQEAAERLGVSKMTVLRQIQLGTIPARQSLQGSSLGHLCGRPGARTTCRDGLGTGSGNNGSTSRNPGNIGT